MTTNERKEILKQFKKFLKKEGVSDNTIISYIWVVDDYYKHYDILSLTNLLKYKEMLLAKNALTTVSQRCIALNKYLVSINKYSLKLKIPKIGQKQFVENIISNEDYIFLKKN